jgi:hypothetical protein
MSGEQGGQDLNGPTGHDYQTHHAGRPGWHLLHGGVDHPALRVTVMTSFWSCCTYRWLLMKPSTKIGPVSPCLMTAHHTVIFTRWSDVFMILCGFSEVQNLVFCLLTHRSGNGLHHQNTGRWRGTVTQTKKSWHLTSPLLAGCSEHLHLHSAFCKVTGSNPVAWWCVLIPRDWEHRVTDSLALRSRASRSTRSASSCVRADLCLPATLLLLSQTLPVNLNFCTRRLIAILLVPVACWISSETDFALSHC